MENNIILKVSDLHRRFKSGEETVNAVNGISLNLHEGEFASVMGPSGSGKTTLLSMIATVDRPDNGSIEIGGIDWLGLKSRQLAEFRNSRIGFIFQEYNLIETLNVRENIMVPLSLADIPAAEINAACEEAMQILGLKRLEDRFPDEISGGEAQRVAAARAMVMKPDIILADEPTGALDSANSEKFLELLAGMAEQFNIAVLMVTHDAKAAAKSDIVYFLLDGRIRTALSADGKSESELYQEILAVESELSGLNSKRKSINGAFSGEKIRRRQKHSSKKQGPGRILNGRGNYQEESLKARFSPAKAAGRSQEELSKERNRA